VVVSLWISSFVLPLKEMFCNEVNMLLFLLLLGVADDGCPFEATLLVGDTGGEVVLLLLPETTGTKGATLVAMVSITDDSTLFFFR